MRMSVVEIMQALPKLTSEERAAVLRWLRELESQDAALFLHEAADSVFRDTDKGEAKGVRRKTR